MGSLCERLRPGASPWHVGCIRSPTRTQPLSQEAHPSPTTRECFLSMCLYYISDLVPGFWSCITHYSEWCFPLHMRFGQTKTQMKLMFLFTCNAHEALSKNNQTLNINHNLYVCKYVFMYVFVFLCMYVIPSVCECVCYGHADGSRHGHDSFCGVLWVDVESQWSDWLHAVIHSTNTLWPMCQEHQVICIRDLLAAGTYRG